jgi:transcriptional regulator with XRE-family HTH domain
MTAQDILLLAAARQYAATGTGKRIRIAAGLSMAEVAEAVGVAEPTIWRWEEGKARPRSNPASIRWAALLVQLKAAAKTGAYA